MKLQLSKEEYSELERERKNGSCVRYRMRCLGVLLKAEGKSGREISEILGFGLYAVLKWVRQYERYGLEGLREKGGRGSKPIMGVEDLEAVNKALKINRNNIKKAKELWEKESGKEVSDRTFRRFIKSHKQI